VAYRFQLQLFEGPLDLLLHLVEKSEIDLYDIPMAEITSQYLDYLKTMQQLDLEVTTEFLVMAATLIRIKSQMLLPLPPKTETELPEDPREELVVKIMEYKRYKAAAQVLESRHEEAALKYLHPTDLEAYALTYGQVDPLDGVELKDLLEAYRRVLGRAPQKRKNRLPQLSQRSYTVNEQMVMVLNKIASHPAGLDFNELFTPGAGVLEVVVTFQALLELIYRQKVSISQAEPFGQIRIYLKNRSGKGEVALGAALQ